MSKRFDDWAKDIQIYCQKNNLSFEKAKALSKCWGKDFLALLYFDPDKGKKDKNGLLDETPLPVVLMIKKTSDGFIFEQTEHTKKYLT